MNLWLLLAIIAFLIAGCGMPSGNIVTYAVFKATYPPDKYPCEVIKRCADNKINQSLVWEKEKVVLVCYESSISGCPIPNTDFL